MAHYCVNGCYDELCALLEKLGYAVDRENCAAVPPTERTAVFLGDLCDRGPKNVEVLRLVMVSPTHGLDITIEQLKVQSREFVDEVKLFLDGLISHYVFDGGKLTALRYPEHRA